MSKLSNIQRVMPLMRQHYPISSHGQKKVEEKKNMKIVGGKIVIVTSDAMM